MQSHWKNRSCFERIVVNSLSKLVATVEHHSMMLMELNQRAITSATNKLSPPPNVPTFPLQTLESFQEFECLISTDPAVWEYMVKRLSILGGSDSESLTRSILRYLLSNEVAVFFNWKGREKLAFENLKVMELIVAAVRVNNSSTQVNELKISNTVKVWLKQSKHRMQSSRKPK